jgi:hypothetical protein
MEINFMKVMEIRELTILLCCDECGREARFKAAEYGTEVEHWFESLLFDLCPKCKLTGKGLERIKAALKQQERAERSLAERLSKRDGVGARAVAAG